MAEYIEQVKLRTNLFINPAHVDNGNGTPNGWAGSPSISEDGTLIEAGHYTHPPNLGFSEGDVVAIRALVRTATGSPRIGIQDTGPTGTFTNYETQSVVATPTDETWVEVKHVCGPGTGGIRVRHSQTGSFWIRNLLLRKLESLEEDIGPYFDGNMSEYWGDSDDDHRLYVWDGAPNNSTTSEYHGGFWTGDDDGFVPANSRVPAHEPPPVKRKFKETFAVEISYGSSWISLHDEINYKVAATDFGTSSAVQRRRIQASSPFYDGTYLIHSTKENISESMGIWVYGQSQVEVSENILRLEELFSQFRYHVRIRYGDHQETWICEPADFAVERSHVYMHNTMALMKFTIPRLPRSTVEVVM